MTPFCTRVSLMGLNLLFAFSTFSHAEARHFQPTSHNIGWRVGIQQAWRRQAAMNTFRRQLKSMAEKNISHGNQAQAVQKIRELIFRADYQKMSGVAWPVGTALFFSGLFHSPLGLFFGMTALPRLHHGFQIARVSEATAIAQASTLGIQVGPTLKSFAKRVLTDEIMRSEKTIAGHHGDVDRAQESLATKRSWLKNLYVDNGTSRVPELHQGSGAR